MFPNIEGAAALHTTFAADPSYALVLPLATTGLVTHAPCKVNSAISHQGPPHTDLERLYKQYETPCGNWLNHAGVSEPVMLTFTDELTIYIGI